MYGARKEDSIPITVNAIYVTARAVGVIFVFLFFSPSVKIRQNDKKRTFGSPFHFRIRKTAHRAAFAARWAEIKHYIICTDELAVFHLV